METFKTFLSWLFKHFYTWGSDWIFGHMNTSYCRHCQKISIIWRVNPNKICSSKLCPIYIWDFDLRIQLLMWKCTCECWEFSLSFSHISNSPWKCIWIKPCLCINLDSQPLVLHNLGCKSKVGVMTISHI
jgi:hypothetical protein